ncbi:membrane-spanning 4-domains subfamily A member 4A-like isoform X3 [Lissotriton helveticus]
MSTTEKEDGCVVITGVDPQGEPSKMGAGAIRSPMRSLQRFYEGEPVALGCIISGSLSVAAANKPRIGLVRGSLATNIISAVTSMASMLIYIAYMLARSIFSIWRSSCDYNYPEMCDKVNQTQMVSTGIMFILLTFSVLQFCVSVSVSAFGCKTICRTAYSEVNVVIYQAAPPNSADPGVSTVL